MSNPNQSQPQPSDNNVELDPAGDLDLNAFWADPAVIDVINSLQGPDEARVDGGDNGVAGVDTVGGTPGVGAVGVLPGLYRESPVEYLSDSSGNDGRASQESGANSGISWSNVSASGSSGRVTASSGEAFWYGGEVLGAGGEGSGGRGEGRPRGEAIEAQSGHASSSRRGQKERAREEEPATNGEHEQNEPRRKKGKKSSSGCTVDLPDLSLPVREFASRLLGNAAMIEAWHRKQDVGELLVNYVPPRPCESSWTIPDVSMREVIDGLLGRVDVKMEERKRIEGKKKTKGEKKKKGKNNEEEDGKDRDGEVGKGPEASAKEGELLPGTRPTGVFLMWKARLVGCEEGKRWIDDVHTDMQKKGINLFPTWRNDRKEPTLAIKISKYASIAYNALSQTDFAAYWSINQAYRNEFEKTHFWEYRKGKVGAGVEKGGDKGKDNGEEKGKRKGKKGVLKICDQSEGVAVGGVDDFGQHAGEAGRGQKRARYEAGGWAEESLPQLGVPIDFPPEFGQVHFSDVPHQAVEPMAQPPTLTNQFDHPLYYGVPQQTVMPIANTAYPFNPPTFPQNETNLFAHHTQTAIEGAPIDFDFPEFGFPQATLNRYGQPTAQWTTAVHNNALPTYPQNSYDGLNAYNVAGNNQGPWIQGSIQPTIPPHDTDHLLHQVVNNYATTGLQDLGPLAYPDFLHGKSEAFIAGFYGLLPGDPELTHVAAPPGHTADTRRAERPPDILGWPGTRGVDTARNVAATRPSRHGGGNGSNRRPPVISGWSPDGVRGA